MGELKKTISTIFMVPTLGIDREALKKNNFINGYSLDKDKEDNYSDAVYLLFHPPNLDKFKEFLDGEYDRTAALIEDYDPSKDFVVLVYSLNPKFKRDFELIKQGKYSKTSGEFQSLFPKVLKVMKKGLPRETTTLQYKIFNKSEDLREYWESRIAVDFKDEMETWGGWIEEKETLDIERIKELI